MEVGVTDIWVWGGGNFLMCRVGGDLAWSARAFSLMIRPLLTWLSSVFLLRLLALAALLWADLTKLASAITSLAAWVSEAGEKESTGAPAPRESPGPIFFA